MLYGTKTWEDFSLHATLLANLKALRCEKPTVIQEKGIDAAARGKDVLGAAPTGSGKTLAFSVPIVDWLLKHKKEAEKWVLSAMIITPTRELALQTMRVLTRLCEGSDLKCVCGDGVTRRVASLIGGLAIPKQQRLLKNHPDIIVGTPGR